MYEGSNGYSFRDDLFPASCTSRPRTIKRGVPARGSRLRACSTKLWSVASSGKPVGESRRQSLPSLCQIAAIFTREPVILSGSEGSVPPEPVILSGSEGSVPPEPVILSGSEGSVPPEPVILSGSEGSVPSLCHIAVIFTPLQR